MDLGDHKTLHQKGSIRAYLGKRRGVVIGTFVWEMIRMYQGRRGGGRGGGRGTGGRERVKEHEMHVINKKCNSRWTSDHQGHEHDSKALALALIRVRLF